jgi:hypothetical protein
VNWTDLHKSNLKMVPSLYIVGMKNCHLSIGDDSIVEAAIHITDCHRSSITAASAQSKQPTSAATGPQQIRIHESSHLEISFYLSQLGDGCAESPSSAYLVQHCRTAVILENSTNILFVMLVGKLGQGHRLDWSEQSANQDFEDNAPKHGRTILEVKDFNWLRAGIASPNFEIKEELSWRARNTQRIEQNEVKLPTFSGQNRTSIGSGNEEMMTGVISAVPASTVESRSAPHNCQNEIGNGERCDGDQDDDDEL